MKDIIETLKGTVSQDEIKGVLEGALEKGVKFHLTGNKEGVKAEIEGAGIALTYLLADIFSRDQSIQQLAEDAILIAKDWHTTQINSN